MKKMLLIVLILSLFVITPIYAQVDIEGPSTSGALSPIGGANAQAGATSSATGGNATINDNSRTTNNNTDINTNVNTFIPTNIQGQNQGQGQTQGQMQGQGQLQGQMNNWSQTYNAPRDLLPAPSIAPPQIQILPGKMWRVHVSELPNCGIGAYVGEEYVKVESFNGSIFNRIRIEDLAEDLLTFKNRVLVKVGWVERRVRVAVYAREAGESASSSGSGAGSYSGNPTPASGVGGTLGILPGIARWKADYQYTVVFYLIK